MWQPGGQQNNADCITSERAVRINSLDHQQVISATTHPDPARGWLEAYLIRQRALHPEKLPLLPPLCPPRLIFAIGEIVEQGTHQQLLDRRGFLHHLYVSQFKGQQI
jgi:hypothetical protein